MQKITLFALAACLLLAACAPVIDAAEPTATLLPPTAIPSPTPIPPAVWMSPAAPEAFQLAATLRGMPLAGSPETATVLVDLAPADEDSASLWVYALAAAFPTVRDDYTLDELQQVWTGETEQGLVMTESTLEAMTSLFGGQPGPGVVRTVDSDEITDLLWENRTWLAILPFEHIQPKMKVLEVDGQSPLRKEFELGEYPLKVSFSVQGGGFNLPITNRDPELLTTVVMTGVTALVRATAFKMETKGITYPAQDIRDWLLEADIAHISNEVPFAENCPYPNPYQIRLIFCSDPKYIELLEYVGTDVVELTGNHFQDWGKRATLLTVEMYRERGWPYYGGGADLADARRPALLEANGMKFAFIGCNPVGPDFAWAREDGWPGAAPCGDLQWMLDEIARLKGEGYTVIATFQHFEYYSPPARPGQLRDFRAVAEAGADIVSGSQAHYAQVMEFYGDSFIHYGLGNFFFDQMGYDNPSSGKRTTNTRREFIDRHVFYNGHYLGTELLTAMLEDYAKPRPMTPEEREAFLLEYFIASGWLEEEK